MKILTYGLGVMMLNFLVEVGQAVVEAVDNTLSGVSPSKIIFGTAALYFLYNQYQEPSINLRTLNNKSYKQRLLDAAYDLAKDFPGIKQLLDSELKKNLKSTKDKLMLQRSKMKLRNKMPEKWLSSIDILKKFGIEQEEDEYNFNKVKEQDKIPVLKKGDGKDSGALYTEPPRELKKLLEKVYGETNLTNYMHDKWPDIKAKHAEVIQWCQELFHGSKEGGYGILTHGGTSSIIEAMAAYVMHARAKGIKHPEIVIPETAHAAFIKAAELTGATLVVVPVDKKTGAVTASEMRKYLSKNTAVMVGSAPSFMNGVYDPIEELGELAQEFEIPFHVDACLGGFFSAFTDTSDHPCDFRVRGVTSISADTHKFGLCPKGTSVLLFSEDSPALTVYSELG